MIGILLTTALTMTLGQARSAAPDRAALLAEASAALTAGRRDEARRLLKETADRFQSVAALLLITTAGKRPSDMRSGPLPVFLICGDGWLQLISTLAYSAPQ